MHRKERRLVRLGQAPCAPSVPRSAAAHAWGTGTACAWGKACTAGVARPLAAERPAVDAITVLIVQLFEVVARDASELRRSKPLPTEERQGWRGVDWSAAEAAWDTHPIRPTPERTYIVRVVS